MAGTILNDVCVCNDPKKRARTRPRDSMQTRTPDELLNKAKAEASEKPVILIADTSPSILTFLQATFQLNNFTVYTATSARECLAIYRGLKDSIDIVLLDGAIAGDQGVEVIIDIRRLKRHQKIMTIVEENNARAMAMRGGADVIVMKPISPDMVLHHVNAMLLEAESFLDKRKAKFARQRHQPESSHHDAA
jgi:DNA-binding response OmpR family regulator